MKPQGSVLIVEPNFGGHRGNHVGIIVRHLRESGVEPELLTSANCKAERSFDHLDLQISSFENGTIKQPFYARLLPQALRLQIELFQKISNYLENRVSEIGCAIFPTLQGSGLIPAGLSANGFPVPWVGVVMAPGAHLRDHGIETHHSAMELRIQRRAYRRLVKQANCVQVGSFDPLFADWMNEPNVVYCPDPVNITCSDNVHDLVSHTGKPMVLIAGSIDKRKKACELADVLASINRSAPLHLVIAGKPNDDIRTKLESSPALKELQQSNSLDLILRRTSDAEMDYLFKRADIVWSGNTRAYGSSGAIVRAGMHGKPVVTMNKSVMGNWMESVSGGPAVDLNSNLELTKVFRKLVSDRELRETIGRKNYELFKENTEQKYCEVLLGPLKLFGAAMPVGNGHG